MSITLSREEGRELLNLLEYFNQFSLPPHGIAIPAEIDDLMDALSAKLKRAEIWEKRDLSKCECDHNEYCQHCWPVELREKDNA